MLCYPEIGRDMSEDQDPYRSEREFLKLLIGLDTGAIGALFYAQERLVPKHYDSIVALYGSGLLLFLVRVLPF